MVIPDRGFSRVARFRSGSRVVDVQPAVPPPASMAEAVWLPARNVTLSEAWSEDVAELPVGAPRRHDIVIEADGVLETQLPEIEPPAQPGIRQYASQPELEREITPTGFKSRRSVSLTVIAQTPGEVTLAPVQVPWWNVDAQRWEIAELPGRTLSVLPTGEPASATAAPAEPPVAAPADSPQRSAWSLVSAALAVAWLVTVALWWRSRRGGRAATAQSKMRAADRPPSERKVLRDLETACAANDADAARRALLKWAERRFAAAPPRSLGSLAALLPEPVAREVLDLEAHLYGAVPGGWDGDGLRAVVPELEAARGRDDDREGRAAPAAIPLALVRSGRFNLCDCDLR